MVERSLAGHWRMPAGDLMCIRQAEMHLATDETLIEHGSERVAVGWAGAGSFRQRRNVTNEPENDEDAKTSEDHKNDRVRAKSGGVVGLDSARTNPREAEMELATDETRIEHGSEGGGSLADGRLARHWRRPAGDLMCIRKAEIYLAADETRNWTECGGGRQWTECEGGGRADAIPRVD